MTTSNPTPTPSTLRTVALRIVRIVTALGILTLSIWYVASNVDWVGLERALVAMHLWWVIVGVCCTMAAHLVRAHRWRVLIPGGSEIRLLDSFSATVLGYLMNNLIPRSGELVRPFTLARRTSRPMSGLVGTVLVERVLDGLTLATIFLVLLITAGERIEKVLGNYSSTDVLLSLVVPLVAIAVVVGLLLKTTFGERALRALGRILPERIMDRLARLLGNFRAGITFGGVRGVISIVAWSAVIWVGYCAAIYCGIRAFGFDTAYGMGAGDALMVLAITAVGVTIAPTPGAFGVYHAFCTAALKALYAVPPDAALAFALVTHAAPYLAVTATGVLFLLRENISLKEAVRGAST